MHRIVLCGLFGLLLLFPVPASAKQPLYIREGEDTKKSQEILKDVDQWIRSCQRVLTERMRAEGKNEKEIHAVVMISAASEPMTQCLCQMKDETIVRRFKEYEDLLKRRPQWKGKILFVLKFEHWKLRSETVELALLEWLKTIVGNCL